VERTTSHPALQEGLAAIEAAVAGVDEAKARLTEARRDIVRRLREVIVDDDPPLELLRELYWHHDELRVRDLADGFGVTPQVLRQLAGRLQVETTCTECGEPMTVERRSRSDQFRSRATCPPCRRRWMDDFTDYDNVARFRPPAGAPYGAPSRHAPDGAFGELQEYLALSLGPGECDGTLRLTEDWARSAGRDVDGVAATVREFGGYCDCEALYNVPPDVFH